MARNSTASDWHVDRPLSNLSIAYTQDSSQFIASKVGTPIPVSHESDKYTEYPQGYWNREYDSTRAEEGVANSVNYNTKERNYSIGDKALRIFISDRKRANADNLFNLDREGAELVTNSLLIGEELDFKDKFLTTGKWGLDKVGVTATPTGDQFLSWADAASDPVGDYKKARRGFILRTAGKKATEIAMTLDVFDALTEHPAIMDRIKTTNANAPAVISMQMIAALFEVDRINIISTVVNTANDAVEDGNGDVPVNNTFLAEGLFLPMHNAKTGGLLTATAIGNFYLPAFTGSNLGPRFRRYRAVEGKDGGYIEGQIRVDRRIVSADMGELWSDVLAV